MSRRPRSTLHQLAALSLAAPAVAATRLYDMATTTGPPSAAQQRDHRRMGMEKLAAAQEGWTAMGMALLELQQREFARAMRATWTPWWPGAWPAFDAQQAARDADAVIAAGLAPVSRAVGANTRRQRRARRA